MSEAHAVVCQEANADCLVRSRSDFLRGSGGRAVLALVRSDDRPFRFRPGLGRRACRLRVAHGGFGGRPASGHCFIGPSGGRHVPRPRPRSWRGLPPRAPPTTLPGRRTTGPSTAARDAPGFMISRPSTPTGRPMARRNSGASRSAAATPRWSSPTGSCSRSSSDATAKSQLLTGLRTAGKLGSTRGDLGSANRWEVMGLAPRPTWSDGKIYAQGANGDLLCLAAGHRRRALWQRNILRDANALKT